MNAGLQPARFQEVLWNASSALKHDDGVLLHEAGEKACQAHDTPLSLSERQHLRSGDWL